MINKNSVLITLIIFISIFILLSQTMNIELITLRKSIYDIPEHVIRTMKQTVKHTVKQTVKHTFLS
ncbi:hypothetical protein CCS41_09230 [Candidatus Fukatsuia symbiotica]|uniref:Uncharacterized protein n=1 Tax=Candidatus Fukatsuia symbiotica TaxID=1878942 RepID=A0A2U8I613_9GAMM|nr:hypothetical protein CCS41_09230 [Candidatus Fukatsuia symbiotica]